ncbi:hypothetical protein A3C17_03785 [Candidatus Uhrbacteria bacterium RIFCSPHIGHO2_02_FULL_53_13]|uniref:Uncharacterized protein n=2 Tax=Candidatus Uhriibacteriota TaxID=1752732 RepID=A0A1F7TYY8_9BACT|nr:MAG: hypothetical protein A3C17_03785 [Candidatus Uhrbacteria bacterium RIFCSPHIGHO2_02_FULL_53_13]OGL89985.1 MAG: hypothetical protein A3I45_02545 [Candidatus Uhrbacteria bacterium RIFCSPLOWO2_02_FULL_53_10]
MIHAILNSDTAVLLILIPPLQPITESSAGMALYLLILLLVAVGAFAVGWGMYPSSKKDADNSDDS